MTSLIGFFSDLFDTSSWPPRWHCGKWTDIHGWIYIGSDLLVWSAYFVIPLLILRYISLRNDTRFLKLYFLFAAFIFACGATHLLDAIMFWWPAYRFTALVKLFTGLVSWATVFVLFQNLPRVFALKSPEELESEVEMRKKTEEDLKIKNRLLNEAQAIARIGHWEWTPDINKVSWSDSLFEIFQVDKATENLAYEHFLNSVHPDDRIYANEKISDAVATGNFENFYHRIVLPGGEIKTIYARGETVRDDHGRIIKIIGTSQDVTDQVRVQQDLLEKTRKLESVNQELQRYAYVASHDLQEPLRKIATFVSMLQRDTTDMEGMSESGRKYIHKIDAASQRMQKLIHDVLMFSSLSIPEDNLEVINLEKLIAEILVDFEFSVQETGAVIEVDALPQMEGYSPQIRQLFQNLISNAIKFRSPDRPLKIHVFSEIISRDKSVLASNDDVTEGGRKNILRLVVQDNGIGFEEVYRDRIFEMFQRLHNREKFEGTGIGLAICKRIAEFHQGRIEVKSEPGKGAAFILTLPLNQSK